MFLTRNTQREGRAFYIQNCCSDFEMFNSWRVIRTPYGNPRWAPFTRRPRSPLCQNKLICLQRWPPTMDGRNRKSNFPFRYNEHKPVKGFPGSWSQKLNFKIKCFRKLLTRLTVFTICNFDVSLYMWIVDRTISRAQRLKHAANKWAKSLRGDTASDMKQSC
jgi:hypothetical protein